MGLFRISLLSNIELHLLAAVITSTLGSDFPDVLALNSHLSLRLHDY